MKSENLKDFEGSLLPCHEIIFEICRQLTTELLELSKNPHSHFSFSIEGISSILLRLSEQAIGESPKIADQCLDAWDILYEHRVGITRELTEAIDK